MSAAAYSMPLQHSFGWATAAMPHVFNRTQIVFDFSINILVGKISRMCFSEPLRNQRACVLVFHQKDRDVTPVQLVKSRVLVDSL